MSVSDSVARGFRSVILLEADWSIVALRPDCGFVVRAGLQVLWGLPLGVHEHIPYENSSRLDVLARDEGHALGHVVRLLGAPQ